MKISALKTTAFPPFGEFEMTFPHVSPDVCTELAEVHVFTGPNGSGKTRILALIAGSLGSRIELNKRDLMGVFKEMEGKKTYDSVESSSQWELIRFQSSLSNWDGATTAMTFCPWAYVEAAEVRTNAELGRPTADEALSFTRPADVSQKLLQGIFTIDLQGATENKAGEVGKYSRMIKALETAIESVTDRSFTFVSRIHPKPELRVRWGSASETYGIETLPDGLRCILGWLMQGVVWMASFHDDSSDPLNEPMILLVDEPETHLHPEWQWKVMPMMQKLFPKAQIFVATHSPFVVSSLNENAWIHRLKVGEGGSVTVETARKVEKGDSYLRVLTEILDVTDSFDPENQGLLEEFKILRKSALHGGSAEEAELTAKAEEIAARGMELEHIIGAEMRQYERQKAQKAKASASAS